jgi:hypothetical protein
MVRAAPMATEFRNGHDRDNLLVFLPFQPSGELTMTFSLYRKIRFGRPIVVVSGLPRSGTSMAMKMLEAGGMEIVTDGIRTADEDNPKGYYELERVKNLHKDEDRAWLNDARGKAIKIISYLLKSLPDEHNYKVIFMNRKIAEVLASQQKMLTRRSEASGPADDKMAAIFERDLKEARFFLRRPHFEVLEIDYNQALEDPRPMASKISAFLGGSMDVDTMTGVVDKKLYRNRA